MGKSKKLPEFSSVEELVEFTETHDMGAYLDSMPEVHFDVDIKKRDYVIHVSPVVAQKVWQAARKKRTTAGKMADRLLTAALAREIAAAKRSSKTRKKATA